MMQTRECDLRNAIETWAMSRVGTEDELEGLSKECASNKEKFPLMPSEMAARIGIAEEVISLELTGRGFADLSSVPRQIRQEAIYSLERQMDPDQEMKVNKQLEASGLKVNSFRGRPYRYSAYEP